MILGFSGTQVGMNDFQLENLRKYLDMNSVDVTGVHGVCVGADEQFHDELKIRGIPIIGRPCTILDKRAKISDGDFTKLFSPEPPLDRNKKIVNSSDVMIVAPKGPEVLRSGTWMTYRYAKSRSVPILFLWWKFFS